MPRKCFDLQCKEEELKSACLTTIGIMETEDLCVTPIRLLRLDLRLVEETSRLPLSGLGQAAWLALAYSGRGRSRYFSLALCHSHLGPAAAGSRN